MRSPLPKAPLPRAAVLGLAHALLLILAFPPVFLPLAALLIPLPALLATRIDEKPKRVALVFGLATAPAWIFFHRWLIDVTLAGYPFLVLILCLYATLFVLAAQRATRVLPWWLAAPLAWTAIEFFRGQIAFDGYPWYLTAQPLAAWGMYSSLQIVGVYGLGFLIALFTAGFLLKPIRATLLAIPLSFMWIFFSPHTLEGVGVSVAVIQTNVPQDNKTGWTLEQRRTDFDRFVELTRQAAANDPPPMLIVWPETMFPGFALDAESLATARDAGLLTSFADQLLSLQRELDIPMLVGAQAFDGLRIDVTPEGIGVESDAEYNSAILVKDGQPQPERYDKLHLTPFGEVMPYISWSDWLESQLLSIGAPGMAFDLDEGTNATVFEVDHGALANRDYKLLFATPICFEATNAAVCRRLAYEDGMLQVHALIQLTNDGWFGSYDGGRETHALIARCRAIELGVSVVRAANTGISTAYKPHGEIVESLHSHTDGVLTVDIPAYARNWTVYGRYLGDSLAWIAFAGTLTAVAFSFRKKKTPAEPAPAPETAA